MTDIFLCTIDESPRSIRGYLRLACSVRWQAEKDTSLGILTPNNCDTHPHLFQRFRRIYAEKCARGPVYILTDDDCMPIGIDFVQRGLQVMESHPEFGILAALNVRHDTLFKNGIPPYTGQFIDDDVWDCHAVGGIRFIRKNMFHKWPESADPGSYDTQHHEALVKAGYKAGYMRNVLFNHLGEGLSQHWPSPLTEMEQIYENMATI